MKIELKEKELLLVKALRADFNNKDSFSRQEIMATREKHGIKGSKNAFPMTHPSKFKIGTNLFQVPNEEGEIPFPGKYGTFVPEPVGTTKVKPVIKRKTIKKNPVTKTTVIKQIEPVAEQNQETLVPQLVSSNLFDEYANQVLIPEIDPLYVNHGFHNDLKTIIKSEEFFPVFISGLSGNGKTLMVEQVCAQLKRECIRVNITEETDEDDLVCGMRLAGGNTVSSDGPVPRAMEKGAVLLLDEIDLGTPKILCLQPVLEGKGIYIKKSRRWIEPAEGFTVIATANTKGQGSESGSFVGTKILNEAFLERFLITMEQQYPVPSIEKKILNKVFSEQSQDESAFVEHLTRWADLIRKLYFEESNLDDIISTRRLVHIARTYMIMNDKMKSLNLCISRFTEETKETFLELYTKVDADITNEQNPPADVQSEQTNFGVVPEPDSESPFTPTSNDPF